MFKFIVFLLAVVIASITFLQKKGFQIHEVGKKGSWAKLMSSAIPTPILTPTPVQKIHDGACFKIPEENFAYFKVLSFNRETNNYHFAKCHEYQGCSTEEQTENFNYFERDHLAQEIPCPKKLNADPKKSEP